MTAILGISAFYHDSAAALVVDGEIVAAAQEERFTRVKHDRRFPTAAIEYCLEETCLRGDEVDFVSFYEKPLLKLDRDLETHLAYAPRGFRAFVDRMPAWLKERLHVAREVRRRVAGFDRRCLFAEHHQSHAASAFVPSPFEEAAILTIDGVGEWATATCGVGRGNEIQLTQELRFPHSLGLLYSAFTSYCGFEVDGGEYKLMGLAPYGEGEYVDLILKKLVDVRPDGSLWLDMSYFNYGRGRTMTSPKFHRLFGGPPRDAAAAIEPRHMHLAASIQKVTEMILLGMARHVHEQTGLKNLCLAGGVALNCVANGKLLRESPFDDIWIQPAAGDAGGALGAALLVWHQLLGNPRTPQRCDAMRGSLLGPKFPTNEIRTILSRQKATFDEFESEPALCSQVAKLLAQRKVVGWFQGRMEFGPRALGNRSILADPRDSAMQQTLNRKIKFRESFRPFAPAVLAEHMADYFDLPAGHVSPYMLLVADVQASRRVEVDSADEVSGLDKRRAVRSTIPAVTHVDYSARVQTVDADRHERFAALVRAFYAETGCPLLVNTSFNVRDEPIVCTPQDAYECFLATEMDVLVINRFVLLKEQQPTGAILSGDSTIPTARATPRSERRLVEIHRDPSPQQLTLFGAAIALLVVALTGLGFIWIGRREIAWSAAAVLTPMVIVYAMLPSIRRPLFVGWSTINYPIAWAMSLLALSVVYYCILTPIGLVLRCFRRDALQLHRDAAATTHWCERKPEADRAGYLRPF